MKTIERKTLIIAAVTLFIGLLAGWLLFGGQKQPMVDEHQHTTDLAGETIWTCSMHPQIRQNEPGDCPICGMDLIPLENSSDSEIGPSAITLSPTAMQLANVSTAVVGKMEPVKQLRLNGKVQADERLLYSQSSHVPGRIEKLYVNFTGEYINKGQIIASVYSPDLLTAQQEMFEAQKVKETQPQLFSASKEKLKNWKLTDKEIDNILNSGKVQDVFSVKADVSGYVSKKMINAGDYIRKGEILYEIADLSKVWVLFDVYESDISWIKKSDKVRFTVSSLPGETFEGKITFLDPIINPQTRVAGARVEFNNANGKLKPEMFASGVVDARLAGQSNELVIPKTAVMWTGTRSVVYIKTDSQNGTGFAMREVTLGPALGSSYIIESGLQQGDEVAVNGTFSIDAAAQLAGKPSMMNPSGGKISNFHNHGGQPMPDSEMKNMEKGAENLTVNTDFKNQLTAVYKNYLKMKDALVASDAHKVMSAASDVESSLDKVDMDLLKGDAHLAWMEYREPMKKSVSSISKLMDIEKQRSEFAKFNIAFYNSLKAFGLNNVTVYYQFCPMAFDNNGAYWLSETRVIRNPYFGSKMLGCGETKEALE